MPVAGDTAARTLVVATGKMSATTIPVVARVEARPAAGAWRIRLIMWRPPCRRDIPGRQVPRRGCTEFAVDDGEITEPLFVAVDRSASGHRRPSRRTHDEIRHAHHEQR